MDIIEQCLKLHPQGWFKQLTREQVLAEHPEIENNPGGDGFYALYSPHPNALYAHGASTAEAAVTALAADLQRGGMVRALGVC